MQGKIEESTPIHRHTEEPEEAAEPIIIAGFEHGSPPLWFCRTFLGLGALVFFWGLFSGPEGWRRTDLGPFALGLMFFGSMLALGGGWLLKVRTDLQKLASAESLSARLGVDETELRRLASEYKVKPRYHVNGRDYYHSGDFDAVSCLLLPSERPTLVAQSLLRPAAIELETAHETLLRPIEAERDA